MECSLVPNALLPFKIYCSPPNLAITRTRMCRLNFAQRPIFSGLRFFNEPEISDSGPPASSHSQRTCAQDFYIPKKPIDLSRVWTHKPWISRRARYPETTEGYMSTSNFMLSYKISSSNSEAMYTMDMTSEVETSELNIFTCQHPDLLLFNS